MKTLGAILVIVGLVCVSSYGQAFDHTYASYDAILKGHVTNGVVDYRAIKAAPTALNGYLAELATVSEREFKTWTESQQIAFLVNLYNAATLKLIVEHYPVKSIKDIGGVFKGPWNQKVVRLFGKAITLNNLEHDIIRKQFKEPRIHMALVCAAKGCPPLRSEAYTAEKLDAQLDDQSRTYLAGPRGLRIDRANGAAHISAIFKWYGEDFESVLDFVDKYSGQSVKGLKLRYLDYDWSLNEQ